MALLLALFLGSAKNIDTMIQLQDTNNVAKGFVHFTSYVTHMLLTYWYLSKTPRRAKLSSSGDVLGTMSNIYDKAFFVKIVNGFGAQLLL